MGSRSPGTSGAPVLWRDSPESGEFKFAGVHIAGNKNENFFIDASILRRAFEDLFGAETGQLVPSSPSRSVSSDEFFVAAKTNDTGVLSLPISEGNFATLRDSSGQTLIQAALEAGSEDFVRLLMDMGVLLDSSASDDLEDTLRSLLNGQNSCELEEEITHSFAGMRAGRLKKTLARLWNETPEIFEGACSPNAFLQYFEELNVPFQNFSPQKWRSVQRYLSEEGYPLGDIDGQFGPRSFKALERFITDLEKTVVANANYIETTAAQLPNDFTQTSYLSYCKNRGAWGTSATIVSECDRGSNEGGYGVRIEKGKRFSEYRSVRRIISGNTDLLFSVSDSNGVTRIETALYRLPIVLVRSGSKVTLSIDGVSRQMN